MSVDLSAIPSSALAALRDAVGAKRMSWPASAFALKSCGLGALAPLLPSLSPLPADAVVLVCDAVLAERAADRDERIELVWTGPDHEASEARETAVVVRQLFEQAQESVVIAGYAFSHGKTIFAPLAEGMEMRGLDVTFYVDMPRRPIGLAADAHVALFATNFLHTNWPFAVRPQMFYDPRTIEPDAIASLHAKCVIVDEKVALVGSANFTERGQERNVEAGLLVQHDQVAARLVGHLRALVTTSAMIALPLPGNCAGDGQPA